MCDHCGCRQLTPVARLMAEHDRLRELTGQIRSALADGRDAAAGHHFTELLTVLGPHVAEEEGALFPALRREPEVADHVQQLESEHAQFYDALDELDDAYSPTGSAAWRDGVLRLLADLDEHLFKEDFGLFPAALALLDGADWDHMEQETNRSPGAGRGSAAGTPA